MKKCITYIFLLIISTYFVSCSLFLVEEDKYPNLTVIDSLVSKDKIESIIEADNSNEITILNKSNFAFTYSKQELIREDSLDHYVHFTYLKVANYKNHNILFNKKVLDSNQTWYINDLSDILVNDTIFKAPTYTKVEIADSIKQSSFKEYYLYDLMKGNELKNFDTRIIYQVGGGWGNFDNRYLYYYQIGSIQFKSYNLKFNWIKNEDNYFYNNHAGIYKVTK